MILGVPKEIKIGEKRVALTPGEIKGLVQQGHRCLVERAAGMGAGFSDTAYREAGGVIVPSKRELYSKARMIVKVKEPEGADLNLLRPGHLLFCYLHLAAHPPLVRALLQKKVTALGFEMIEEDDGSFPCLTPMSEIAGRVAVQLGASLLGTDRGGSGILLAGASGIPSATVVVLGAGTVGQNAARIGKGIGARVLVYERNEEKTARFAREIGVEAVPYQPDRLPGLVAQADLLIGAILVPGQRAPHVVSRSMVAGMRPGSVIVDVAIDQGGCVETSRPTTLARPTFIYKGVIHCCVPNLPSLVARTATKALARSIIPWVSILADRGADGILSGPSALRRAVNVRDGQIVHPALK